MSRTELAVCPLCQALRRETLEITKARPVSRKEIVMSITVTPKGPGSISGAPNLPAGFTETFTTRTRKEAS